MTNATGPDSEIAAVPLDGLTVPVPCTVPWDTMTGDERIRYCGQCRLHVHDLSAMTREDAVAFLVAKPAGERVCVRMHRRPDGRVVTADCRKVVRAIRRRALLTTAAVLGALGLGGAAWARTAASNYEGGLSNPDLWESQPFRTIAKVLPSSWLPQRTATVTISMGVVCPPNPPKGTPPVTPQIPGTAGEDLPELGRSRSVYAGEQRYDMTQSAATDTTATDTLDGLTVPVPCTVPWETMTGDERIRYCGQCRLHVHDLSAMTRADAVAFLIAKPAGERLCVRFHRRPDGRVVTADCRKVVRAIRRRALLTTAAVLGALGLGGAAWARAAASNYEGGLSNPDLWESQPFRTIAKVLPASWLPQPTITIAGDICVPSPTPPVPPLPAPPTGEGPR